MRGVHLISRALVADDMVHPEGALAHPRRAVNLSGESARRPKWRSARDDVTRDRDLDSHW
jgi:hypothetical protein